MATSNAPRVRNNKRDIPKEPIRETVREPVRADAGNQVVGRDGKALSRKRGGNSDRFHIPAHLIPEGWTYEWKRETLYGQEDPAHMIAMGENGWTPVDASVHPGYFMPKNYSGPIRRDGMILMERPKELTEEARAEDVALARAQMRAQSEQLGLQLPKGFSGEHNGVRPRVSQTYQASDVARPALKIEG